MLFLLRIFIFLLLSSNVFCNMFTLQDFSRDKEIQTIFDQAFEKRDRNVWEEEVSKGIDAIMYRWELYLKGNGYSEGEIKELIKSYKENELHENLSRQYNNWICAQIEYKCSFLQESPEFLKQLIDLTNQHLFEMDEDGNIKLDSSNKPILQNAPLELEQFDQAGEDIIKNEVDNYLYKMLEISNSQSRSFDIAKKLFQLDIDLSEHFLARSLVFEDYLKTIFDIQRYNFINRKKYDLFSLKKEKDKLEALAVLESVTAGINSEIDSKTENLKSIIDQTYIEERQEEIELDQWRDDFFRILDDNLDFWKNAERKLLNAYSEWELKYGELYENENTAWDKAFEYLIEKKSLWEEEFSKLCNEGLEFWQTENELVMNVFLQSKETFERSFSSLINNSKAYLDSVLENIRLKSSLKKSTEDAIFYQLESLEKELNDEIALARSLHTGEDEFKPDNNTVKFIEDINLALKNLKSNNNFYNTAVKNFFNLYKKETNARWKVTYELWENGAEIIAILNSTEKDLLDCLDMVDSIGVDKDFSEVLYDKVTMLKEFWEKQYITADAVCKYLDDNSSSRLTSAQTLEAAQEAKELADMYFSQYQDKLNELEHLSEDIIAKQDELRVLQETLDLASATFAEVSSRYSVLTGELSLLNSGEELLYRKLQESSNDYIYFVENFEAYDYLLEIINANEAEKLKLIYLQTQYYLEGDGFYITKDLNSLKDIALGIQNISIGEDSNLFIQELNNIGIFENDLDYNKLFELAEIYYLLKSEIENLNGTEDEEELLIIKALKKDKNFYKELLNQEFAKIYLSLNIELAIRSEQLEYLYSNDLKSWAENFDIFKIDSSLLNSKDLILENLEAYNEDSEYIVLANILQATADNIKLLDNLNSQASFDFDIRRMTGNIDEFAGEFTDYLIYLIETNSIFMGEVEKDKIVERLEDLVYIARQLSLGEEFVNIIEGLDNGTLYESFMDAESSILGFDFLKNAVSNFNFVTERRFSATKLDLLDNSFTSNLANVLTLGRDLEIFNLNAISTEFVSLANYKILLPKIKDKSFSEVLDFVEGIEELEYLVLKLVGKNSPNYVNEYLASLKEFAVLINYDNLSKCPEELKDSIKFKRFSLLLKEYEKNCRSSRMYYDEVEESTALSSIDFSNNFSDLSYYLPKGSSKTNSIVIRNNYLIDLSVKISFIEKGFEKNFVGLKTHNPLVLEKLDFQNIEEACDTLRNYAEDLDTQIMLAKGSYSAKEEYFLNQLSMFNSIKTEVKNIALDLASYKVNKKGFIDQKLADIVQEKQTAELNYQNSLNAFNNELNSVATQELFNRQTVLLNELAIYEKLYKEADKDLYCKQAINDYASGIYFTEAGYDENIADPYFLRDTALNKFEYFSNIKNLGDIKEFSENYDADSFFKEYEKEQDRSISVVDVLNTIEKQLGSKQREYNKIALDYQSVVNVYMGNAKYSLGAISALNTALKNNSIKNKYLGIEFNFINEIFYNGKTQVDANGGQSKEDLDFVESADNFIWEFASLNKESIYKIYRVYAQFCSELSGVLSEVELKNFFSSAVFNFYEIFKVAKNENDMISEMAKQDMNVEDILSKSFYDVYNLTNTERSMFEKFVIYTSSGIGKKLITQAEEYFSKHMEKVFLAEASKVYKEREEVLEKLRLSCWGVLTAPLVAIPMGILADKQDKLENLCIIAIDREFPGDYVFQSTYENDKKELRNLLQDIMKNDKYKAYFKAPNTRSKQFIDYFVETGDTSISHNGISLQDIINDVDNKDFKKIFEIYEKRRNVLVARSNSYHDLASLPSQLTNLNSINTNELTNFKKIADLKSKLTSLGTELKTVREDKISNFSEFENSLTKNLPEAYRKVFLAEDKNYFKEVVNSILEKGSYSFYDLIFEVFLVVNDRVFSMGEKYFEEFGDLTNNVFDNLNEIFEQLEVAEESIDYNEKLKDFNLYTNFANDFYSANAKYFSKFAKLNIVSDFGVSDKIKNLVTGSYDLVLNKKANEEIFLLKMGFDNSSFERSFEEDKWMQKAFLITQRGEGKWEEAFDNYLTSRMEFDSKLSKSYFDQKMDWEFEFARFYQRKEDWLDDFSRQMQNASSEIAMQQLGLSAQFIEEESLPNINIDFNFQMPDFSYLDSLSDSLSNLKILQAQGSFVNHNAIVIHSNIFHKADSVLENENKELKELLALVASQKTMDELNEKAKSMIDMIAKSDINVKDGIETILSKSGFELEGNYYIRRGVVNRSVIQGTKTEHQLIDVYKNFILPKNFLIVKDLDLKTYIDSPYALHIIVENELERLQDELILILGDESRELSGEVSWAENRLKTISETFSKKKLTENIANESDSLYDTDLTIAKCDNPFDNVTQYKVIHQKTLTVFKEGGLFGDHVGYAPFFKPDAKWINPAESLIGRDLTLSPLEATIKESIAKKASGDVDPAGEGEMGRIMSVLFAWDLKQEKGYSDFSKNLWELGLWDDEGSIMPAPTIKEIVNFVGSTSVSIAGMFVGMPWLGSVVGLLCDLGFAALDSIEATSNQELQNIWLQFTASSASAAVNIGFSMIGAAGTSSAGFLDHITSNSIKNLVNGGISLAQTAMSNIVNGVTGSLSVGANGLEFDDRHLSNTLFGRGAASSFLSTIGSTSMTAGLNAVDLKGFLDHDLKLAESFSNFSGTLVGAGIKAGINQELSANILNVSDFINLISAISAKVDSKKENAESTSNSEIASSESQNTDASSNNQNKTENSNTRVEVTPATPKRTTRDLTSFSLGLLELTLGKDNSSLKLGNGGENFSVSKFVEAGMGLKVFKVNNDIIKSKEDNIADNAEAMRALYSYNKNYTYDGSKDGMTLFDNLISGQNVLVDVFNEKQMAKHEIQEVFLEQNFQAKTELIGDQKNIFFNSSIIDDKLLSKLGFAVTLQHEAYRDGIENTLAEQERELQNAFLNHSFMATIIDQNFTGFLNNNQRLREDVFWLDDFHSTGEFKYLKSYIDHNYNNTEDYWLYNKNTGAIYFDGKLDLCDYETGKIIEEFVRDYTYEMGADGQLSKAFDSEGNEVEIKDLFVESIGVQLGMIPETGSFPIYYRRLVETKLEESGLVWKDDVSVVKDRKKIKMGAWVSAKEVEAGATNFTISGVETVKTYGFSSFENEIKKSKAKSYSTNYLKGELVLRTATDEFIQGNAFTATKVGFIDGSGIESKEYIENGTTYIQNSYSIKDGTGKVKQIIDSNVYEKGSGRVDVLSIENVTPENERLKAMTFLVDENGVLKYEIKSTSGETKKISSIFGLASTVPDPTRWSVEFPALLEGDYSYMKGKHIQGVDSNTGKPIGYDALRIGHVDGEGFQSNSTDVFTVTGEYKVGFQTAKHLAGEYKDKDNTYKRSPTYDTNYHASNKYDNTKSASGMVGGSDGCPMMYAGLSDNRERYYNFLDQLKSLQTGYYTIVRPFGYGDYKDYD